MNYCTWKDLLEVAFLKRGIVISKDFLRDNNGIYPVYSSQTVNDGIMGYINTFMFDGEFLTWTTDGANAGTIFHRKGKFNITNVCGLIEIKDDTIIKYRFLYFWLSYVSKQYVLEGMGNPKLMSNRMGLIKIPLPHIKVQEEIVKILDSFTNLIDALNEELSLRQKQFEYYREKLLNSNECSKTKKLQYFAKIMNGKDYKHLGKGQIPLMGSGGIMGYVDSYLYNKKSVLLPRKGSIDKVYYIEEPFWTVDTLYWTKIDEKKIIPKFLYYILSSIHIENYALKGGIPSMTQSILNNIDVPYIDKDLQQSIVEKLDAFESLISSLKEEIALRQKQYEYYREKLLTFD